MTKQFTRTFSPVVCVVALAAVVATSLLHPTPGVADDSVPPAANANLSLGEVLAVAVRQSPALADASIDVAVADASLAGALASEDWLLAARLSFLVSRDEAESGNVVGTDKVDRIAGETTISKVLPTGGQVGLTISETFSRTVFEFNDAENTEYTSNATLFLNQPLLRGRGEAFTRSSQRSLQIDRSAAILAKEASARSVVRQVIDAYWQLVLAYRSLEISRSSLELAKERKRITKASVDAGQVARTELDAVDQIIATRSEEILSAELLVSERSIELRRVAGLEIGAGNIDVAPTATLAVPERSLDVGKSLEAALTTSPELAILRERGKGATIDIEVAKNGLLPRLDVSLQAGSVGTGSELNDSLKNAATIKGYQISGALDFSYELGRQGAQSQTRAAHEARRKIKVNERDVSAQVAVAVVRAVKQAQNAAARIKISETVIALATKNIESEKARFQLGRSTNFQVLERQEELKQANLRRARAAADYLRSLNVIDELTGESLSRNGIEIPQG